MIDAYCYDWRWILLTAASMFPAYRICHPSASRHLRLDNLSTHLHNRYPIIAICINHSGNYIWRNYSRLNYSQFLCLIKRVTSCDSLNDVRAQAQVAAIVPATLTLPSPPLYPRPSHYPPPPPMYFCLCLQQGKSKGGGGVRIGAILLIILFTGSLNLTDIVESQKSI